MRLWLGFSAVFLDKCLEQKGNPKMLMAQMAPAPQAISFFKTRSPACTAYTVNQSDIFQSWTKLWAASLRSAIMSISIWKLVLEKTL